MTRTRVAALALVNWKGVFFERYLLDRHVTALEGANGAGKTTVMIAAYVVLLPDMTRLRFTNLGESGATGGDRGIWGRLGEPGRPSYAALDLDLDGQRVVLGVCLTRTTEPTVEPTAFIVNSLPASARLSDFLLQRRDDGDHVPELAELKLAATQAGGEIQVFRSVKEYFSALFDRGITPLCLAFEEERNKWNDMLRTSMTGGISRALGTELRSFLLRQEGGLSDTLSRMRDNLESCRRTRLEVYESRQLEREISAIYEAGLAMFSAALHAARAASLEANVRAREAAEAHLRARQARSALAESAAELERREAELALKSEQKRQELQQLEAAKQRRAAAAQLSVRLQVLNAELEVAEQKLSGASVVQEDKQSAREAAQQAREWSLEAYDRASVGLSSLQKGLEELARRAHAHKELTRCLEEARSLLGQPELQLDQVEAALSGIAQQRTAHEAQRATLTRHGRDIEVRRQEHAAALAALEKLEASELLKVERSPARVDAGHDEPSTGATHPQPAAAVSASLPDAPLATEAGLDALEAFVKGADAFSDADDESLMRAAAGESAVAIPLPLEGAAASDAGDSSLAAATGPDALEELAGAVAPELGTDGVEKVAAPLVDGAVVYAPGGPAFTDAAVASDEGAAVATLQPMATSLLDEHARARGLLARAAELEAGGARLEQLESELRSARRLRVRQQSARELADELGLHDLFDDAESAQVPEQLSAVERELRETEQSLQVDADSLALRQRLQELRHEHASLDQRAACYLLAQEAAKRIAQRDHAAAALRLESQEVSDREEHALRLESQEAILGLRDRLLSEQAALAARRDTLEAEREQMQAQAAELNRGAAVYDAELLRVRDELGAELLAARFEDLEPEQAAWVEARLGPWVDALVVDDLEAAAGQIEKASSKLDHVHLVRAGASLELTPPEAVSGSAILVEEPLGTRITRLPTAANLGRRAREAKLKELWESIAEHATALEQNGLAIRQNAAQRRDADVLWTHAAVFLGPDPLARRQTLDAEIAALEQRERDRDGERSAARGRLSTLRSRAEGLRRLLPDAQLLGPPDYKDRAAELEAEIALMARARKELSQLTAARSALSRLLDVLRSPPPDDAALAEQTRELQQLESELDRIFHARSALEGVIALRHAAPFADAQAALDAQAELSPALEQQQKQARQQLKAAETAYTAATRAWESANGELQAAQAQMSALSGQRDRLAEELVELGGAHDQHAAESAEQQLAAAASELQRLEDAARKSVAERALAEERRARAENEAQSAQARQSALSAEAEPIEQSWNALRSAAESAGVLHAALSIAAAPGHSSFELQAEAKSKRELLIDRVARARGGDELLQSLAEAGSDLESWQAVRAFLGRRVPAQIAQVDDPLIALNRLSDHLNMLEARLTRQEGDLRGNSEDVARAIAVQLRRATSQVRRLNQQLDGIRFGSIHGIRMEMRRIERMEQILHALREGQAQELLFSSNLPIEEALEEIFKRYGGGGKSGGQRLLDYREYVELAVEIQRQNAESWEPANPTRLSTGEAIGVGAALMMVVLTEWERAANLLGPRNKLGSVRFLFLDEANRLSRDNLGVLFDLCRTLDLQLLVAAPEVARADGNTTYRLVRHTTADGREEVIVSGRRSVPVASDAPPPSDDEDPIESEANAPVETPATPGLLFDSQHLRSNPGRHTTVNAQEQAIASVQASALVASGDEEPSGSDNIASAKAPTAPGLELDSHDGREETPESGQHSASAASDAQADAAESGNAPAESPEAPDRLFDSQAEGNAPSSSPDTPIDAREQAIASGQVSVSVASGAPADSGDEEPSDKDNDVSLGVPPAPGQLFDSQQLRDDATERHTTLDGREEIPESDQHSAYAAGDAPADAAESGNVPAESPAAPGLLFDSQAEGNALSSGHDTPIDAREQAIASGQVSVSAATGAPADSGDEEPSDKDNDVSLEVPAAPLLFDSQQLPDAATVRQTTLDGREEIPESDQHSAYAAGDAPADAAESGNVPAESPEVPGLLFDSHQLRDDSGDIAPRHQAAMDGREEGIVSGRGSAPVGTGTSSADVESGDLPAESAAPRLQHRDDGSDVSHGHHATIGVRDELIVSGGRSASTASDGAESDELPVESSAAGLLFDGYDEASRERSASAARAASVDAAASGDAVAESAASASLLFGRQQLRDDGNDLSLGRDTAVDGHDEVVVSGRLDALLDDAESGNDEPDDGPAEAPQAAGLSFDSPQDRDDGSDLSADDTTADDHDEVIG